MTRPPRGRHGLHVYRSDAHLARSVATFTGQGLRRGSPVILVPTRAHREPVLAGLREAGIDVAGALGAGRLVLGDAEALVERALAASPPSVQGIWDDLSEQVEEARARGSGGLSIWGEAADQLRRSARPELFKDLETRWCERAKVEGDLDVLCSFQADLLDEAIYHGDLQDACELHNFVFELEDALRLATAVDAAVAEVLGPRMRGMAWSLADAAVPTSAGLPQLFARLLWLKDQMPATWGRVVALARVKAAAD